MAVFLNNKVGLKINAIDLSDHVTSVTLNQVADELEVTAMGDTAHKFVKGLESATLTVSFLNDTAASNVMATLRAAFGTTVAVKMLQERLLRLVQPIRFTPLTSWSTISHQLTVLLATSEHRTLLSQSTLLLRFQIQVHSKQGVNGHG